MTTIWSDGLTRSLTQGNRLQFWSRAKRGEGECGGFFIGNSGAHAIRRPVGTWGKRRNLQFLRDCDQLEEVAVACLTQSRNVRAKMRLSVLGSSFSNDEYISHRPLYINLTERRQ